MRSSLASLALLSMTLAVTLGAEMPCRVACVGDSLTAGAMAPPNESYPAQLGRMLGAGYDVKNYGKGGATLWHGGSPNAAQELPVVTAYAPNVAVVMFGINDTRSRDVKYWDHFGEFEADYAKIIEALLALPSKPRVLLCLPTALHNDLPNQAADRVANVTERLPRLEEVRAKVQALGAKYQAQGVEVVDLYAVTKDHPEDGAPDGVHLKAPGYKRLAEALKPRVEAAAKAGPHP